MKRTKAVTHFGRALVAIESVTSIEMTAYTLRQAIDEEAFQAVLADGLVLTVGDQAGSFEKIIGRILGELDEALRAIPDIRRQFRATRAMLASIAPDLVVDPPPQGWDEGCAWCGDSFHSTRRDARYCSPGHRQAAYRARRAGNASTALSPEP